MHEMYQTAKAEQVDLNGGLLTPHLTAVLMSLHLCVVRVHGSGRLKQEMCRSYFKYLCYIGSSAMRLCNAWAPCALWSITKALCSAHENKLTHKRRLFPFTEVHEVADGLRGCIRQDGIQHCPADLVDHSLALVAVGGGQNMADLLQQLDHGVLEEEKDRKWRMSTASSVV